jgi:FAD/FMN-containing dehydrogenase
LDLTPHKKGEGVNSRKEELTGIVGKENVLDAPETLKAYSWDQSFVLPIRPSFVVNPKNTHEVEEIVAWANRTRTPLIPVSSGPPRFRGDTVPSAAKAVIVDLSGWKKIVRIDRRNRMVLIEPGITFSQLQPELAKEGLRLSTPLLPRANKSVVASLLEREPILIPRVQWAMLDPLRCLEVVWGDGNRLMTGEAGSFGSLEEDWKANFAQVAPPGPAQTDFYKIVSAAEGSMGIVTWASIKCEVLPRLHKLFFVPSQRLDNLIDFLCRVLRFRFGDELLLLNGSNLASILGNGIDQIRALQEEFPPWVLIVGVAGREVLPEERVEFQRRDISDIAQQFGLQLLPAIPGAETGEVLEAFLNPSKDPYWKLGSRGGCQDIFFLTTLNRTPEFVKTIFSVAEACGYPASEIGVYIQPVHQGASCHCEFSLPFDPEDPKEVTRARTLFTQASEALLKQGAFFSRPYGIWANMAYNRDAQTTAALRKIKKIFDPNNIMNPGKLCF